MAVNQIGPSCTGKKVGPVPERSCSGSTEVKLCVARQACSSVCIVRATSAKFTLHAGNMKFISQNEECT